MSNDATKSALASRRTSNGGDSKSGSADLRVLIERQKPQIARALAGTALDPERFTRIALTTLRQTPELMRCRPESVLGSLMTAAQLGLEPGPLGEAYLVPFRDECTFIAGYRGLVKLAWQSGQLRHIDAADVHENDVVWRYKRGSDPVLEHEPALTDRGPVRCYYAVATITTGGFVAQVFSPEDIEVVRKRAASSRSSKSPWQTDYDAMARKTCIRALSKYLPMATTLHRAIAADETSRSDISTDLDELASDYVDGELVDESATPEPAGSEQPAEPQESASG